MSERTAREIIPQLPKGCGYMGHDFGASYIDSQCYGGRLYDLDNGDCDGDCIVLYEPLEYIPCPICNCEDYIQYAFDDSDGREERIAEFMEWRQREVAALAAKGGHHE